MQQGWGGYAQFGMLGGQPQYGQIQQSGVRQVPGFSNGHYMSSPSPSSSSTHGGTGHQQNANRGINKTPTPIQQPTQFHSVQRQLSAVTIGSASSTPPVVPARSSGASSLAPTQQTQATPDKFGQKSNNGGRQHWPLELWICRHGETVENNTRTIAGQNSSGLTEHGREQASLLGERLTNVEFVGIYISDLNRTKQTADAVLRARAPGTPAFTDSRLREKGAGSYEGQKIGYIEKMTQMSGMPHRVFRPPGGESWEDVSQRSRSFMREVLSRYCTCTDQIGRPLSQRGYDSSGRPINTGYAVGPVETKRVLIITHGGFMSEFLSLAVGGVPNCAKNCSIFVLACARDHPQGRTQFLLKVLNEVSHLDPLNAKGMVQSGPEAVTETKDPDHQIDEEDADKSPDDVQSNSSTIHTATATPDSLSAPPMAALSAEPLSPSNALPNSSPKPRSSQSCVSPPNMTDAIIHGHASMSEKLKHLEAPASDSNIEKSSGGMTSVHDTTHKSVDTHCRPTGVAELKVETTEGKPNMPNMKPPAQCAQKSTASPSIHMMAAANRQTPSHHGQQGTQLPSKPSSASTTYRADGNERHTFPLQGTHGGR